MMSWSKNSLRSKGLNKLKKQNLTQPLSCWICRECSGSVVECLTRDRGASPASWVVSLSKNIYPSLVLVQPRKTRPFITERLLMGHKESNKKSAGYVFVWFDSLCLINNLSVIKGQVFLGWTSPHLRLNLMCLAQGHNTVMPVRLEPMAPQSRVKHSTTELPCWIWNRTNLLLNSYLINLQDFK